MQVGRDQHKGQISFRSNDTQGKQLRLLGGANFLHDLRKHGFGDTLLLAGEQLPLREIDPVKKVQTMPAFFWNKGSIFVGHRASFRRGGNWSRAARSQMAEVATSSAAEKTRRPVLPP